MISYDREKPRSRKYFLFAALVVLIPILSCGARIGNVVITKPDEYHKTFAAKEEIILRAIAGVFRDKKMGSDVVINREEKSVRTDYITQDDWRTKSMARIKRLNWKECEVVLSVITEKKTKTGWEMRRLLEERQYENLFYTIELKIYEEMAKVE
jgi:hypothetical protein